MNTCLKNWLSLRAGFTFLFVGTLLLLPTFSKAQCVQNAQGQFVTALGEPCVNTIITAVPFLRMTPNARSAGMGDAGIAISADASALHFNASKLVFAENKTGFGLSFTPWLSALEVNDVYLAYGSGYYQINEKNAVGLGVRYFSLGEIDFTDANGMPLGTGRPNELEFNASYARKIGNHFSGGFGLKYIYSNLAAGQEVGGEEITAGTSFAADFSFTYQTPFLTIGLALTNLGQGITYTNSDNKDLIPANLGIGIAWNKQLNENNRLTLTTDINKLLVPTPDPALIDANGDGIPDFRQKDYFSSVFGSFSDASGGFSEELRELMFSFGGELLFRDFMALRAGYFTEHSTKGNRKYLTIGLGYTYKFVTLNGSYLVPLSNQNSPLDNTFRVSLLFNFGKNLSTITNLEKN